jgi:hypothetical protein
MALKQPEYIEGPEALRKFNKMMTRVFRAPKTDTPFSKPKPAPKKKSASQLGMSGDKQ